MSFRLSFFALITLLSTTAFAAAYNWDAQAPYSSDEAQSSYVQKAHYSAPSKKSLGYSGNRGGDVWSPFLKDMAVCAPGCRPYDANVWRHDGGPSCHNVGRAVDVFGITCGNKNYMAINRGRFEQFVGCMRHQGLIVLYRNGRDITQGHHNHGHFSLGCHGGRYW